MQVVILVGGLGTRLRSIINDRPKSMAVVAGKPFLEYLIEYLKQKGFHEFLFLVGYKSDMITSYFGDGSDFDINLEYSYESNPLGTGGALQNAWHKLRDRFLLVNGDTLFKMDYDKFIDFHLMKKSVLSIATRSMINNTSRYGKIVVDNMMKIIDFNQEQYSNGGIINGGTYLVEKKSLDFIKYPKIFSFEKEYLHHCIKSYECFAYLDEGYFIDIGVPDDLIKFESDLKASPA